MRKPQFIFLILIFTVVCCTNQTATYKKLVAVDSLLNKEENDSALSVLKEIDANNLTEDETAYYNLLLTQTLYCLYIPIETDSMIDVSMEYYKKMNDMEKLVCSYYYKGMIMFESYNNFKEAVSYLKKAELLSQRTNNLILREKVCSGLAFINLKTGNTNTALEYTRKALELSYKTDNKQAIWINLDQMSWIFNRMDMQDSVLYYASKSLLYIEHVKDRDKPLVYSNVAAAYLNKGALKEAKENVLKSLSLEETPHALYTLGSLYIKEGKPDEAWELWSKALDDKDPEIRAATMNRMAELKKERGEYKEAIELEEAAKAINDSLRQKREAENMLKIQGLMEREDTEKQVVQHTFLITMIVLSLVVMLVIYYIIHFHRDMNRAKRIIADNKRLIEEYSDGIYELNGKYEISKKEIYALSRKIEQLRKRNAEILGRGRRRYDEIMGGGNVAEWHKEDFEAAIEYVRTLKPEAVAAVEKAYRRITPYNTLFLLMPELGMSDADISRIMNMTEGALRTMKCRLRRKMKE